MIDDLIAYVHACLCAYVHACLSDQNLFVFVHFLTDCLIKAKIIEELKYLFLMRKLLRKMVVFSEFSFWFSFDCRTRILAWVKMSAVKLHGLFQFELKIYSCENVKISQNESGKNSDKTF